MGAEWTGQRPNPDSAPTMGRGTLTRRICSDLIGVQWEGYVRPSDPSCAPASDEALLTDVPSATGRSFSRAQRASAGATLRSVLASIPDFALAGAFLVTWINPYVLGELAVQYFLLTMLLEFIIVHSSGFMGSVAFSGGPMLSRMRHILGLGLFYSLFVGGFALGFSTWWPLYAFWGLTLNRMLGVLIGDAPVGQERKYVRAGWALSVMYYLGGAFATVLLPVPALGLTHEVRTALDLPGEGMWVDEPQRVLAFGVVYFALTGVGELLGWARNETFLKGVPAETG